MPLLIYATISSPDKDKDMHGGVRMAILGRRLDV